MSQAEYDRAVAGLKMKPQRHYQVNGMMPNSRSQIDMIAKKAGLVLAPVDGEVAKVNKGRKIPGVIGNRIGQDPIAQPELQAPANPAPAKPPAKADAPKTPAMATPTSDPAPSAPATAKQAVIVNGVEIPANLATLPYNDKRSLAAKIGVSPVPQVDAQVNAAIEEVREKALAQAGG